VPRLCQPCWTLATAVSAVLDPLNTADTAVAHWKISCATAVSAVLDHFKRMAKLFRLDKSPFVVQIYCVRKMIRRRTRPIRTKGVNADDRS
jgi:hypothetical protein